MKRGINLRFKNIIAGDKPLVHDHAGNEEYISLMVAMDEPYQYVICKSDCNIALEPDFKQDLERWVQKHLCTLDDFRSEHYLTIGQFDNHSKDKGFINVEVRSKYTDHVRIRYNWMQKFSPIVMKMIEYAK